MAIYHLSAKIIGRSAGRSVVAAAAWQSSSVLYDERIGQWSRFTGKRLVEFSSVLLPEDAPEEYRDRGRLWNAIELVEKRDDAQLARQYDMALPDELPTAERIEAVRRFASVIVEAGYPVDVAVIQAATDQPEQRHHGYVMMTTRPLANGRFLTKGREWNTRKKLVEMRVLWADILNKLLEDGGHPGRVDHRSNKDRGIDAEPGDHVGVIAKQMARRGEKPDRLGS
jgi:ATP-dependent exoDNAse (exonuclease V) alpha subunit